jgi:lipid-binding SYLF domain-containing protein
MLTRRAVALGLGALPLTLATTAQAASTAADINRDASEALDQLYRVNPVAQEIAKKSLGILIFPKITKGGLIFGGSYGEGVLRDMGKPVNYYSSVSASWGPQAGVQTYSYVVFLITSKAIDYLHASKGWEIGVGPTVVIVNEGAAKNLSTSTLKDDAYAFIFGQQGLMAGVSIEGSKITKIKR